MSNSPFPGMDPYLERFWRNVHHRLVTYFIRFVRELGEQDVPGMTVQSTGFDA